MGAKLCLPENRRTTQVLMIDDHSRALVSRVLWLRLNCELRYKTRLKKGGKTHVSVSRDARGHRKYSTTHGSTASAWGAYQPVNGERLETFVLEVGLGLSSVGCVRACVRRVAGLLEHHSSAMLVKHGVGIQAIGGQRQCRWWGESSREGGAVCETARPGDGKIWVML